MDIIKIIHEVMPGVNPLAVGYIILCFVIFKMRYETKKDIKIMEKEIIGFMKEVNESIKEERKLNYQVIYGLDKEIHNVLKQLGECVGELRGKKEIDK